MSSLTVPLTKKLSIPLIGLGTWQLRGKECEESVLMALKMGYRHIDTAHLYENHANIGHALLHFPREELFITSKFNLLQVQQSSVEELCDAALKDLRTDYLDLYLLHFPSRDLPMQKTLEETALLLEKGKIKSLGVSNCTIHHLQDILGWNIPICANQVEFHPYLYQKDLLDFCHSREIRVIAYRTFGKGELISDPKFIDIAKKHNKSVAQILLRWCLEKEIPVIPKASSKKHLEENMAITDFSLSTEDRILLDSMSTNRRFCQTQWSDFDY